nr:hypothetical protein [Rhodomonas sp. NIES-2332]
MTKKKFRLPITKAINTITAFFFFYSIGITAISSPIYIKDQISVDKNIRVKNNVDNNFEYSELLYQEALSDKIYLDLFLHKILNSTKKQYVTQISINKEGKIIGYKSNQLRLITYSVEKQMINLLSKNVSIINNTKSVYWLSITNKH